MLQLLSEKTAQRSENAGRLSLMQGEKEAFIGEQQRKINQLHNYLDDKLRCIVTEYNKAVEGDFVQVKNNLDRLDE